MVGSVLHEMCGEGSSINQINRKMIKFTSKQPIYKNGPRFLYNEQIYRGSIFNYA